MPAKTFIRRKPFNTFVKRITQLGFKKMTDKELDNEAVSNQSRPPRKQKNRYNLRSNKYSYEHKKYEIKLLPSYVKRVELTGMNKQDSGWVRFTDPNGITLHVEHMFRTKYFLPNMYDIAKGFAEVLERIPLCKDPNCRHHLKIVPPPVENAYWDFPYLVCPNLRPHKADEPISILSLITDNGALTEIKNRMSKRRWYEKELAKIGKKPGTAKAKRKKWKTNPPKAIV